MDYISHVKSVTENKETHIQKLKQMSIDVLYVDFKELRHFSFKQIENLDFLFGIAAVCWSRQHFLFSIIYLFKKRETNSFFQLINILKKDCLKWESFKELLLKSIFMKKNKMILSKISDTIADIAKYESSIYLLIEECMKGHKING
jgi:hypothetical protein